MSKAEHLGDDRYRVRIYVGKDPATGRGRQVGRNFRAPSQRAANKMAAQVETDLRKRASQDASTKGTVAELAHLWGDWQQRRPDISPTTTYRNASILAAIVKGLGRIPLDELNGRHVDEWYLTLQTETPERRGQRRRSAATVHHYHRVLQAMLRKGVKWRMIDRVATDMADKPKRRDVEVHPPTAAVLNLVLSDAPPDLHVAAYLAARTGLRRGELLGLCWTDIEDDVLHVRRSLVELPGRELDTKPPKSDRERRVPIDKAVLGVLEQHHADLLARQAQAGGTSGLPVSGPVFADIAADPSGWTPRRPGWLSSAWRAHCRRHGAQIRFHDLRHWHATQLLAEGRTLPTVAKRLGHAQTSTTLNIYGHGVDESDRLAAETSVAVLPW